MELSQISDWIRKADSESETQVGQAFAIASVVKFCSCFEGSKGIRSKPLSSKKIFNAEQRALFSRLLVIRNKMAAHDDQLFPMHMPLIILDREAHALDAIAFMGYLSLWDMPELKMLRGLTEVTQNWVRIAFDSAAENLKAAVNAMDQAERNAVKAAGPPTINIRSEDRLAKKR